MKLKTHYVFSAGVISVVLSLLNLGFIASFFISFLASIIGNTVIDRLGHEMKWTRDAYIPTRTPLTHTLPRSVIWGLVSVLPVGGLYYYMYEGRYFDIITIVGLIIAGILVGPTHMLLDAFTEKGIYVRRNGRWVRYALAHFRYDNPFINGLAIIVGVVLLILSYYISQMLY